jgi:hypothetical protein
MLTLDDLEHFSDASMAHLFAPSVNRADADKLARLARIVACLNACRDVPTDELAEVGLVQARFHLKVALRQQSRASRPDPTLLLQAAEAALAALGQTGPGSNGPAVAERLEVEAEILAAAVKLAEEDSLDPQLLGSLARGEFELVPSSDLASLAEVVGKFGATAQVDVDLSIDMEGPSDFVRVRLVLEGGLWRWTALDGCCMSRNGNPAFFLPPDDAVVQALLAGLAVRSGRSALAWAEAV